jgi:hypothetical protein
MHNDDVSDAATLWQRMCDRQHQRGPNLEGVGPRALANRETQVLAEASAS